MAVTRLKRKGLRNKARAKQRKQDIKDLTRMPPILNVDVDAIKEEFAKKSGKSASKPKADASQEDQATAAKKDKKAAPAKETASAKKEDKKAEQPAGELDTTAELREPAKGAIADAKTAEKAIDNADDDQPTVAPDVVTPEAGTPDETPSEADKKD